MPHASTPRRILDLLLRPLACLAPPRCRHCRTALLDHDNPFLCRACVAAAPWILAGACRNCGFPAGPHAVSLFFCSRCRNRKLGLTATAAVVRYRLGARSLVRALKYHAETEIAPLLGGLMAERLRRIDFGPIDLVLPVPLHPERRRTRGFDQAELIGRATARQASLPLRRDLLEKIRHTSPQALLRREQRLANMDGAFRATASLSGARVLLIDDVLTTGATMGDCARACREAGATRVYALTFAR